jgi:hypothetical protein
MKYFILTSEDQESANGRPLALLIIGGCQMRQCYNIVIYVLGRDRGKILEENKKSQNAETDNISTRLKVQRTPVWQ